MAEDHLKVAKILIFPIYVLDIFYNCTNNPLTFALLPVGQGRQNKAKKFNEGGALKIYHSQTRKARKKRFWYGHWFNINFNASKMFYYPKLFLLEIIKNYCIPLKRTDYSKYHDYCFFCCYIQAWSAVFITIFGKQLQFITTTALHWVLIFTGDLLLLSNYRFVGLVLNIMRR